MFLNATCGTALKRHGSRHHRAVTFVAGNATAAAPAVVAEQTTPLPRARPTLFTARPADRPGKPLALLKTAQQSSPTVATQ
jgi:hypothetical protein